MNTLHASLFRPILDFEKIFSYLNFTPEESFMASRFDNQRMNVDQLCQLTGISDERVARFVYALHKMGYLELI
jgi:hypothetical protein